LPPFFTLSSGYVVRLTALDATTGNVVAGVVVSGASIDVDPGDTTPEEPINLDAYLPAFSYGPAV